MRSRTSRGVSEWSGGKELYIGSDVSAIRKVSGSPGIVPGPPEGSRGSTGWGHLSRRAPWAEVGREPAPSGLGRPPWAPLRLGLETLGVGGAPPDLGGKFPPWSPPPCRSLSGSVQVNGVDGVVLVVIQITDDPSAERTAPPRSTHVRSGDVSSFLIQQGGRRS